MCHMLQNEWRTTGRAKIAVLVIFIAACVYNIPRFFEREVVLEQSCIGGEPTPYVRMSSLRNNRVYFVVYKTICYFIFRSVGPLVALIALNSRLAVELRNVDRRRSELHGRSAAITATKSKSTGWPVFCHHGHCVEEGWTKKWKYETW